MPSIYEAATIVNLTAEQIAALKQDIQQHLNKKIAHKTTTLYNAIDVSQTEKSFLSKEDARQQLNLPIDAILFGNAARLVINKDHATLIKAFFYIKKSSYY